VLENPELVAVVAIQAVLGPDPEESLTVLENGADRHLGQPLLS
jgi:hypothetical protein